jgi:hypothetical protein
MIAFDQAWQALTEAHPQLNIDGTKVTLSVHELQELLLRFYMAGEEAVLHLRLP